MARTRIMQVSVHPISVDRNGWCDDCALPSVVTVIAACELDGQPWRVITCALCTECWKDLS